MWKQIRAKSKYGRTTLCKDLEGKALFTAMLRPYVTTHYKMTDDGLADPWSPLLASW
jgi:hypothetical protein